MKEIKFRGMSVTDNVFVFGNYAKIGEWHYVDSKRVKEAQQYIGEKDKNGKEIYEGDIVKMQGESKSGHFRTFQGVVTDHGVDGYTIDFEKGFMELGLKNYEYEVIGNVYENKKEANTSYHYSR